MNKTYIVEINSKRTTKVAVLSVVIVGMMVVLVPMLIDEADAITSGIATSTAGPFSNVGWSLQAGYWTYTPQLDKDGNLIWETRGTGWPFPGDERGFVYATVGKYDKVFFYFNNPSSGTNTCSTIVGVGLIQASCHIPSRGSIVTATYSVSPKSQESNNEYCDILNKFDGIDQSSVIREKLHC